MTSPPSVVTSVDVSATSHTVPEVWFDGVGSTSGSSGLVGSVRAGRGACTSDSGLSSPWGGRSRPVTPSSEAAGVRVAGAALGVGLWVAIGGEVAAGRAVGCAGSGDGVGLITGKRGGLVGVGVRALVGE